MAREFAKVYMSIWGNPDFTRLTVGAQRLYMFLISQPDLSRAGTITLAFNRWQSRTADYEREALLTDLAELARARFVVVDEATEELLIRSYIRNDEGWKSPNIMIAVAGASKQVMSETLRAVIAQEVARIDTAGLPVKVNEKTGRSTKDFIDMVVAQLVESLSDCVVDNSVAEWGEPFREGFLEPLPEPFSGASGNPFGNPSGNPSGNPFGNPSGNPFGKGSLTTTTTATTTATATATATTTSKNEQFDTFWELYPRKVGKDDARKAFTVAAKKHDPDDIIAGASRYAADPNLPGKQFIPHPGKWLRGGHWQDEPLPERQVLFGRRDERQELFDYWEHHYSDPDAANPFMIEGTAQ
jgi:hypothetical protein